MTPPGQRDQPKSICPYCLAVDAPLGLKTFAGHIPLPDKAHAGAVPVPALCLITLCGSCSRPWGVQWMTVGKTPFDSADNILV